MNTPQMSLFDAPRPTARLSDALTSHKAAAQAQDLSLSHDGLIIQALRKAGTEGLIKDEIAALTRLTDIQVARRLSSLEERYRVQRVKLTNEDSGDWKFLTRANARGRECCVWRIGPKVSA